MPRARVTCWLVAPALFVACALGPRYRRPEVVTPAVTRGPTGGKNTAGPATATTTVHSAVAEAGAAGR